MVIVRILGGFASQLQQYSIAYLLAQDKKTELYLDLSEYVDGYFRPFMLSTVTVPDAHIVKDSNLIKNAIVVSDGSELIRAYESAELPDIYLCSEAECYRDFFNKYPHLYPDVKLDLLKKIRLKEKSDFLDNFEKLIKNTYSIGVHVRLGDFETLSFQDNIKDYKAAIGHLLSAYSDAKVFFFSNNIAKAKEIFGAERNFYYINHKNGFLGDVEEFFALSMCRGKIISTRSGYSRYAVYVGINAYNSDRAIYLDKLDILKDGCDRLSEEQLNNGFEYYKDKYESAGSDRADLSSFNEIGLKCNYDERYDTAVRYDFENSGVHHLDYWRKYYNIQPSDKYCVVLTPFEGYNRWYQRKRYLEAILLGRLGIPVLYINEHVRNHFDMPLNELTSALDMDGNELGFDLYLSDKKVNRNDVIKYWVDKRNLGSRKRICVSSGCGEILSMIMQKLKNKLKTGYCYNPDKRLLSLLPGTLNDMTPFYYINTMVEEVMIKEIKVY